MAPYLALFFLVLALRPPLAPAIRGQRQLSQRVTSLLDTLLHSENYDKRIRPDFGGPPAEITVNMYIKSLGPIDEKDETYSLDCYFRQTWYDKRLQFNTSGLEEFSMNWLFLEKVWKPDTYFVNGKKSYLHQITVPNKFLRLRFDGFLTYSMRLTIKASCPMFFRKFPLDSQACWLEIGSYGYSNRDVVFNWKGPNSVGLEEGVEMAQYDLVNITTKQHLRYSSSRKESFSTITVWYHLQRHTGYYMLQVYLPCGLIVSCSWVSFWIDPTATPARVSLGVTTVLSMTTLGFGGRSQMPRVSYATAIDWYVILCFSFVFASMVEYAAINFVDKVAKDMQRKLEEERKHREEQEAFLEEQKKALEEAAAFADQPIATVENALTQVNPELKDEKEDEHKIESVIVKETEIKISDVEANTSKECEGEEEEDLEDDFESEHVVEEMEEELKEFCSRWFVPCCPGGQDDPSIPPAPPTTLDTQLYSKIDVYARRMFPFLFFFLNSCYWLAFLFIIPDEGSPVTAREEDK